MHECAKNSAISELVSASQLKRFTSSISDLESAISIILKHSDNKELVGKIAFDTLMMAGTISASWQMLLSLERASNAFNNTSSVGFLNEKTDTVKHFIDFILPRYLSNFTTIAASTE
ncbi:MAG: acyl-CoA dehydrogenase C-terminal domain-containing protein, partial [Candidatus Thioglobus sp.]|nr:acyl-CoA dehydrogenase C-terminal domain-containing protein [Candidatus Thioglobus sp.]